MVVVCGLIINCWSRESKDHGVLVMGSFQLLCFCMRVECLQWVVSVGHPVMLHSVTRQQQKQHQHADAPVRKACGDCIAPSTLLAGRGRLWACAFLLWDCAGSHWPNITQSPCQTLGQILAYHSCRTLALRMLSGSQSHGTLSLNCAAASIMVHRSII
jgi:hypothetical protein